MQGRQYVRGHRPDAHELVGGEELLLKLANRQRGAAECRPCKRVRHDSPGSADLSELMLCVATIGMQRACRAREKNFSSPDGSFSPVVAKDWYWSHMNATARHGRVGSACILDIRFSTAR